MNLKELRQEKKLTQKQCAEYLNIPLRTYIRYESHENKSKSVKYRYMTEKLERYGFIDETHGILALSKIKSVCEQVFSSYQVEYCFLFGSYARQKATENSDIDLLISTQISGLKFYELAETLRTQLKKKVDVINLAQLENNPTLLNEILKEGIKIYG